MEDVSFRVLVADDNSSDRFLLSTIIRNAGHAVYEASNGSQAVTLFAKERPDIVLMDALMPEMDGFEAAQAIRSLSGEDLIPIIFLTSLKDPESLAKCLDVGGTDFLSKPYNRIILDAKIRALGRLRSLQVTVQEQRDILVKHHKQLVREQEVAKRVFDNIAHPGCVNSPNVKCHLSPMAVFNGDMVLASRKPDGGMFVLIGDFTGHGLPAAIGAMPAAEIFYGMTNKGFSLQEILAEINTKLSLILPVGVFCCVAMVDFAMDRKLIQVWSGGLPNLFLKSQLHGLVEIEAKHLPLGVLSPQKFRSDVQIFEMEVGDRLYLWSDGIHEANNVDQQMFGDHALNTVFEANQAPEQLFQEVLDAVDIFTNHQAQDDDHTFVEVTMVEQATFDSYFDEKKSEAVARASVGAMDWELNYTLNPITLRTFNPLPLLTHILMEVPGLRSHSSKLYTILAELYSNALEHGVLGIDSQLKVSSEGFAEYYRQREARLNEDFKGYVRFCFRHTPRADGGALVVRVEDTGPGFDYAQFQERLSGKNGYCGRGIPLLLSLCERFEYFGNGNAVEAEFWWDFKG